MPLRMRFFFVSAVMGRCVRGQTSLAFAICTGYAAGFKLPIAIDRSAMNNDKLTEALVQALKQALAQPGEQRLFRSGKLPGVFAGRAGLNAEAAAQALRDGLLEVTRTETKGKTTTEFVRATPKGVEFLHQHES